MIVFLWIVGYLMVGLIIAIGGAYFMSDSAIDDVVDFMLFSTFSWPLWIFAVVVGGAALSVVGGLIWVFQKIIEAIRNKKAGGRAPR